MNEIIVVCAIIIEDEKVYCTQRGPNKSLAYKWEFPGGKVEDNEIMEDALSREIKEELKCNIKIVEYFATSTCYYDFGVIQLNSFICKFDNSLPTLTEHINDKWVSIQDIRELDWAEADIPIINKLIDVKAV